MVIKIVDSEGLSFIPFKPYQPPPAVDKGFFDGFFDDSNLPFKIEVEKPKAPIKVKIPSFRTVATTVLLFLKKKIFRKNSNDQFDQTDPLVKELIENSLLSSDSKGNDIDLSDVLDEYSNKN